MFSRFFIDRPIFASVLSIVITLAGSLALLKLPLAQYPPVAPPTVQVNCSYPGASAEVVAQTVAAPIEQQVNGVEKMLYMESRCNNDGSYNLTVTFQHGVDLNLAQVLVQNRVNLALPSLPDVLKKTGVSTRKMSPDILMSVNINSPNRRYDQFYLSNYALMNIRDELLRLPGIGDIFISGQRDYSMRIWLDPQKLAEHKLTAVDVVAAIREQNRQVALGQIGMQPAHPGQETQITLTTLGRLVEPEQFADIVLRATRDGRIVRLGDVARVAMEPRNQDVTCRLDGKESVGLIIFQLPDANALEVADRIHQKMKELSKDFPEGLIYESQYDTTPYTRECIQGVVKSLSDSVMLVALVVLLFLQNWRSALIPLVAVPVAIIGTFGVLALMGFSLNNLTLFGLVLAIGIVVDDSIVVVEAVEHHIELGLSPREATLKAMSQVSGPVITVGLVLTAVFVPCALFGGITGQFFRQFAVTVAASTLISTFNSLSLSPALSAMLLRPRDKETHEPLPRIAFAALGAWIGYRRLVPVVGPLLAHLPPAWTGFLAPAAPWLAVGVAAVAGWFAGRPVLWLLSGFFRGFNAGFRLTARTHQRAVSMLLRVSAIVLVVYGGLLVLTWWNFTHTPKGFIPTQDMGYLLVNVQLPDAAAAERTREVTKRVQEICLRQEGVKHTFAVSGMSFMLSANLSNLGSMFVILKDFDEREKPGLYAGEIAATLRKEIARQVPEGLVTVLPAPPIRGIGRTGGYKLMVEDVGDVGLRSLQEQADRLNDLGNQYRPPLPGIADLPPVDQVAARKQRTCPVDGDALGSKGLPIKVVVKARPVLLCCQQCREEFDQDPDAYLARVSQSPPMLINSPNVFRASAPQLFVELNRMQCMALGVPLADVFATLQVFLGSYYVNDFNRFGRTWQVIAQADATFRNQVEKIRQLKVRSRKGGMVPLGTLADVRQVTGPFMINRFNMRPAATIQGEKGTGVSSRQAIELMQQLAEEELAPGLGYEWSELAFFELQAGTTKLDLFGWPLVMDTGMLLFTLAVIMVFLVLAAQYESWSLPMVVILVVPMCLLSAVVGVTAIPAALTGLGDVLKGVSETLAYRIGGGNAPNDINIFTQIGFVVLVGLASKNAILLVEFAKRQRDGGASAREAALAACKLRLRPIVMTSCAFILGVSPLLIAHGAGAEMRRTLGTAVFSGMLGVTLFGLFLTPVFFTVVDRISRTRFFTSRAMRVLGTALLMVLTLGLVWLVRRMWEEYNARRARAQGRGKE